MDCLTTIPNQIIMECLQSITPHTYNILTVLTEMEMKIKMSMMTTYLMECHKLEGTWAMTFSPCGRRPYKHVGDT